MLLGLIASLAALIHLELFLGYVGNRLEPLSLDLWFRLRGRVEAPDDVIIIAIDRPSYDKLGVSFLELWPRETITEMLGKLSQFQPRRVVFDLIFAAKHEDQNVDSSLTQALRSVPTVLASDVVLRQENTPSGLAPTYQRLVPQDMFASAAETVAAITLPVDFGIVRRARPPRTHLLRPPLALAEAAAGLKRPVLTFRDYINYYGPAGSMKVIPFYRLFDQADPLPAETFRDKVVFVGYWLPTGAAGAVRDSFMTPYYGDETFGVEIQATAAANILHANWIQRLSPTWEIVILEAFVFLSSHALLSIKPLRGLFAAVGLITIWGLSAYYAFLSGIFLPGLTAVVLVLPILFILSTSYYYLVSYRAQSLTQDALSRYLTPEMAQALAKDSSQLKPGGKLVEATMLFSDIASFTSMVENREPEEVSRMLNRYFEAVAGIILSHHGTVIQFSGDGMFVIWGAPLPVDNASDLAVESAVCIQREVERLIVQQEIPPLRTRIGIHRGLVLAGNLGSARRFDYTAVGDAINLTSRLEQLNKHFGTSILISDDARINLRNECELLLLGTARVTGREELVKIHAVFSEKLANGAKQVWEEALAVFSQRNWSQALNLFEEAAEIEPKIRMAASFYKSCVEGYFKNEPLETWTGEIVFQTK